MSTNPIRSDASPFTPAHEDPNRRRREDNKDDDDEKAGERRPSRGSGAPPPPVLASQLQQSPLPKELKSEERYLKTLRADEDENSTDDDDLDLEEGDRRNTLDVLCAGTEETLNLGGEEEVEGGNQRGQQRTLIQNNTVFGTVNGDIYIGGGGGRGVTSTSSPNAASKRPWSSFSASEQSHIRTCSKSRRQLREADLLAIATKIGLDWRSVGNGLKLNHAVLDLIESECGLGSLQERVEMMLFRWIQWKCERATVARLTKALYNHKEFAAILAIEA